MSTFCCSKNGRAPSMPDYIELASIFAGRDENHRFSRQFVLSFIERHKEVLFFLDRGEITSPTRCLDTTQEKTQEFVSLLDRYMKGNTMNKRNIFVFDEIGDSNSVCSCGHRRKTKVWWWKHQCLTSSSKSTRLLHSILNDWNYPFQSFHLQIRNEETGPDSSACIDFQIFRDYPSSYRHSTTMSREKCKYI